MLNNGNSYPLISASLLSADGSQLGLQAFALEKAGADWLHLDVMDGHFVPSLTMGPKIINDLRPWSSLPFDVHLMVTDPKVDAYIEAGANLITFHPHTTPDPQSLLSYLKQRGCKAGIAISPGDSYGQWPSTWWALVDMVTVMAVPPGAAGQAFSLDTPQIVDDIKRTYPHICLSVDGGINDRTAPLVKKADVLVSGSFIFSNCFLPKSFPRDLEDVIESLKNPISRLRSSIRTG